MHPAERILVIHMHTIIPTLCYHFPVVLRVSLMALPLVYCKPDSSCVNANSESNAKCGIKCVSNKVPAHSTQHHSVRRIGLG